MTTSEFGITIPADARHIRIVRLVGSSISGLVGFDEERIDDVKIALGEMASTLLEVGGTSPVEFTFRLGDRGHVDIAGRVEVDGATTIDEGRFAFTERVLAVVADAHDFAVDGTTATFTMSIGPADHEAVDV